MKKIVSVLSIILITATAFAQTPQKMSYQAVIRDANSQLIVSAPIGMRISILQGSATGAAVYVETQLSTSNSNGLVTIEIGNGNVVSGVFGTINWANGPYFIKTETDPLGGTAYTISGTTELMSVPYSLHAKTAENGFKGDYIVPRIATKGQRLSVSFSGGENLAFSQSSSTCPNVYANAILSFTQGTPTIIYPVDTYYIDSKRFDAVFDIPAWAPAGVYDIIIGPSTSCPYNINTSFKIQ